MRVHHLNCGTMRAPGGDLVCHVLLAESDAGLVLIDTGFGLADIADPRTRLGPPRHLLRPALEREETAVVQVQRLGFKPSDVRHIVVTHFDLDHIGGLADFPQARVHVTAAEADGALRAPTGRERRRFRSVQWSHGPDLVEHGPGGESWRGFAAARSSPRSARASSWSRSRGTPAATPVWRSTPGHAGCCTVVTRSITGAR